MKRGMRVSALPLPQNRHGRRADEVKGALYPCTKPLLEHRQMRHFLILALLFVQLISCNSTRDIKLYRLNVGMSESEVAKALRKKPDNAICAKKYPDGQVEVLQYSRYELDAYFNPILRERYWLFFYNDQLVKWQRAGRDCEAEADRVYGMSVAHRD